MTRYANDEPTITIIADHGPLVERMAGAIRDEGGATHTVSTESGWVASASRALVVVDSPAGLSALRELCELPAVRARVVVVLTGRSGVEAEDLCDRCIERHDIVLVRSDSEHLLQTVTDELVGAHVA